MQDHLLLFVPPPIWLCVLLSVALAGLMHLHGSLRQRPILIGERKLSIIAVILCHSQLVIGLLLYLMNFSTYSQMGGEVGRFWKMEHIGVMVIAIALVTIGRVSSKRAKDERLKQKRVAIFYLIALALMLWAIPWPSTELGRGRGWL